MTIDELVECSKYWIPLLGLSDWKIVLKVVHQADMCEEEERQGEVLYSLTGKQAIVKILDPADWNNDDFMQDMEKTLVHELLHLRFDVIDCKDKTSDKLMHQLLNDVSRWLVGVNRK